MIYLSAQPDSIYFIWQLEIQLRNFNSLGIPKTAIHVLVGVDPKVGLQRQFDNFIQSYKHLANFFIYTDTRDKRKYTSSIRPHIIKKHFKEMASLQNEVIFYHDSDVLLSRVLQIEQLYEDGVCYVSDTRNYLDSAYIIKSGSEKLLEEMAAIVGIPVSTIIANDENSGGAQYILKNLTYQFWEKVETDCEALFDIMNGFNKQLWLCDYRERKSYRSEDRGIQAWCADMWAVLWNLWYFGNEVHIHSEMEFSWPNSPIEKWKKLAVFHYSGHQHYDDSIFKKTKYINFMPWYDQKLNSISEKVCSYKILNAIEEIRAELDQERTKIPQTCIVLVVDKYQRSSLDCLLGLQQYINKKLNCKIQILLEDFQGIPFNVNDLGGNDSEFLDFERLRQKLNDENYTEIIFWPIQYFLSERELINNLNILNANAAGFRWATSSVVKKIDLIFTKAFIDILDEDLLKMNLNKFELVKNQPKSLLFIKKDFLLKESEGYHHYEEFVAGLGLSMHTPQINNSTLFILTK